ncbi:DNA (cytosine-5-)-methyltransferase [Pyruvatibacter sp. HU-CL02332]
MWTEAVRAVREIKPKAFIFENVKGLTRATFNEYFSYIQHQLRYPMIEQANGEAWSDHMRRLEQHHSSSPHHDEDLVYNLLPRVLNAADYGVPQRRERVVIVGFRADLNVTWSFPAPTHSIDSLLWQQKTGEYWEKHQVASKDRQMARQFAKRADRIDKAPKSKPWRTVRDALVGLEEPIADPSQSQGFADHKFQPGAKSYPGHTGSPLDLPAKTLKAGVHGVPGGENMLARRNGTVRYFTVRESARLQTFPDEFVFHGAWSEVMRQLGNAVPVELAHVVARHVAKSLKARSSQ